MLSLAREVGSEEGSCSILTLMILRLEVCLLKKDSGLVMLRYEKSRSLVKCPEEGNSGGPHLIHHHSLRHRCEAGQAEQGHRDQLSVLF